MEQQKLTSEQLRQAVFDICNDMYSRGEKISVRLILAQIDSVSSTSTIHKYYAEWRQEIEANEKSLYDKLGFSPEFTKMFLKEVSRFGVEAEARYKQLADDANGQRHEAITDLAKAEDRLHKQNALVEQHEKRIKDLEDQLNQVKVEANDALNTLGQEKDTEIEKLVTAHAAEIEKLTTAHQAADSERKHQLEVLANDNRELMNGIEAMRMELATAKVEAQRADSAYKDAKGDLVDAEKFHKADMADLRKEIAQLTKANTQLSTDLATATAKVDTLPQLNDTISKLTGERDTARAGAEDLKAANSKLTADLATATATLKGSQTSHTDQELIQAQLLEAKNDTISRLERQLEQLQSQLNTEQTSDKE